MSRMLELLLLDAVVRGQGIYPKSIVRDGVTTERTEWQEGWNASHLAITKNRRIAVQKISALPDDRQLMLEELLEKCHLQIDIQGDAVSFAVNMNDTFYYACADSEDVAAEEIDAVHKVWKMFGYDGVVAWAAIKRGCEPIDECITSQYREAYKALSS